MTLLVLSEAAILVLYMLADYHVSIYSSATRRKREWNGGHHEAKYVLKRFKFSAQQWSLVNVLKGLIGLANWVTMSQRGSTEGIDLRFRSHPYRVPMFGPSVLTINLAT